MTLCPQCRGVGGFPHWYLADGQLAHRMPRCENCGGTGKAPLCANCSEHPVSVCGSICEACVAAVAAEEARAVKEGRWLKRLAEAEDHYQNERKERFGHA